MSCSVVQLGGSTYVHVLVGFDFQALKFDSPPLTRLP